MRKFRVPVFVEEKFTGIQQSMPRPSTTVEELIEQVCIGLNAFGITFRERDFRALAYKEGRWLKKEEILYNLPSQEHTIVLVAESEIARFGDSPEFYRVAVDYFTTYLNWPEPEPEPETENKITILFLASDPSDFSRLRLGEEFREIDEQLTLAKQRERFNLVLPRLSLRPKDIARALLNEQPQIVHFSSHGTPEGALCFEDESGKVHLVQPEALAALFKQFADQTKCVILNACYAEHQATAIAKHIDYVIGMSRSISDKAAIAFSLGFYAALGAGKTIEEAFEFGRVQIMLQGIPEHLVPVLIRKSQQQP